MAMRQRPFLDWTALRAVILLAIACRHSAADDSRQRTKNLPPVKTLPSTKTPPPAAQRQFISHTLPRPARSPLRSRRPKPKEVTAAIRRGIQFLLDDQRPDGSWGSPEDTKGLNIYAPLPALTMPSKAASPVWRSWR